MKRVLNVGGGDKSIGLPGQYDGFEHVLLDIDPAGGPDIVCDARRLDSLEPAQFDAIYCSHNLEHYHRHEVPKVLAGFLHLLRPDGFAQIRVPDMEEVMRQAVERRLDIEDTLYDSPAGPITVLDVIYGYGIEIERSGRDFYAHKTGFSNRSLARALQAAGFSRSFSGRGNLEINVLAFKGEPAAATRALFGLP
jgi:SAM-dependent methyltransferase